MLNTELDQTQNLRRLLSHINHELDGCFQPVSAVALGIQLRIRGIVFVLVFLPCLLPVDEDSASLFEGESVLTL